MSKYKLSIIIPTYNAENYLLEAIGSVKNQSIGFENIELILVDDNSSDNTKSILEELNAKYENVKTIFLEENSGSPSKPRNIGIKNASSEYIMFLDNDDSYQGDFCEKMYSTIVSNDVDIVSCRNYDICGEKINKYHSILDKKDKFIYLNSIEEDTSLLSTTAMLIWNKIYKKSLFLKNDIQFPEGTLYEDVYFNLQAYINAHGIIYLNDYYGYNYNIRTESEDKSTSQDFKKENLFKFYNGLENIFNYLDNHGKYYKNFESEMLIGFIKWLLFTDCSSDEKLDLFRDFKKYYKRYSLFVRLYHIKLIPNMLINLGIKFISFNDVCFKILAGLLILFSNINYYFFQPIFLKT